MLLADDERIYAFARRHEGTELLVFGNFSGDEVSVELPAAELLIANVDGPRDSALQPWEARVLRRGIDSGP
jgi:oligo-1,6-glucosidase